VICTRKRPLSAFLAAYFVLLRRELLFSFFVGFLDFFRHVIPSLSDCNWAAKISQSRMFLSQGLPVSYCIPEGPEKGRAAPNSYILYLMLTES
jgi:hypothetical protein